MKPTPEVEALRAQIQQRHVEHVQIELDLIRTFLDMGRVEYSIGEKNAGAKSITHARQAITGARAGVGRIDSDEDRASLGSRID